LHFFRRYCLLVTGYAKLGSMERSQVIAALKAHEREIGAARAG
jgi:hypothetical protein